MKESKKYILLDFDDVIFDASKFKKAIAAFVVKAGISAVQYEKAYTETKRRYDKFIPSVVFDSLQSEALEKTDTIKREYSKLISNARIFIFRDAIKFLEKLKNEKLYLITYGDKSNQKIKVDHSGIKRYFSRIIITEQRDKSEAFKKILGKNKLNKTEEVFFLDDKARYFESVKKKYPRVKTVLVKRRKNSEQVKNEYCDYEIKNLSEAEKIIRNDTARE